MDNLPGLWMYFCGLAFAILASLSTFIVGTGLFIIRKNRNKVINLEEQKPLDLPRNLMIAGGIIFLLIALCQLTLILASK